MDGWIERQIHKWSDGWMDGWIDIFLQYTVGTESIQTPLNFSLCYIAAIC